jgi:hypothetical protein
MDPSFSISLYTANTPPKSMLSQNIGNRPYDVFYVVDDHACMSMSR